MAKLEVVQERWDLLLTPSQVEFVNAWITTGRVAPVARQLKVPDSTVRNYLKSAVVMAAVKLRQKALRDDVIISPSEVITDQRILRDMAMGRIPTPVTKWSEGVPTTHYLYQYNAPAAQKAVESLGKIAGMYVERKEITIPASDSQIERRLEQLLGVSLDGEFTEVVPDEEVKKIDAEAPPEIPEDGVAGVAEESAPLSADEIDAVFEEIVDLDLNEALMAACDQILGPSDE